ncbi:MAG: hypothetical protein IPL21_19520 [Saprospirales bacterium]|nr:hypothetical protein [Saprospirales bacterium]
MKNVLKFTIIILIFTSNNCIGQKKEVEIPNQVSVNTNIGQTQMYGTHVFIKIPENFKFNQNTNRYENSDLAYIKVVENNNVAIKGYYEKFIEKSSIEEKDGRFITLYKKEFLFHDKQAIFMYGIDNGDRETEELVLVFGDSSKSIMLIGRYRIKEKSNRDIIIKSFLSAYIQHNTSIELIDIQKYSIDLSNSRFKYNTYSTGVFAYTINGKGNPIGKIEEGINITQGIPLLFESETKAKAITMIDNYTNYGIEIINSTEKSKSIDNNYAYETLSKCKYKNEDYLLYSITVSNTNNSIYFVGTAKAENVNYIKEFERIAETIKIK